MPRGTVHNNDDQGSPKNPNIGYLPEAKPFETESIYSGEDHQNNSVNNRPMNAVSYKPFLQQNIRPGLFNTRIS